MALIVLGIYSEVGVRPKPMVPAGQVPGFLFLCVGTAFGVAVFDRYLPKWGNIVYFIPAALIFVNQTTGRNSALPLLLYAGTFQLLRVILRVVNFESN